MALLLTGASGFIGKRVLAMLANRGETIVAISRRSGTIDGLEQKSNVHLLRADICSSSFLEKLSVVATAHSIECVIHCAASLDFHARTARLQQINVQATMRLFRWCQDAGVQHFVFLSSIEACGPVALADVPAAEETSARPVSSYGRSKLEAEKQLAAAVDTRARTGATILRLGNVYGEGSAFSIADLARGLSRPSSLGLFQGAWQDLLFNPIHVNDAVALICECAGIRRDGIETYNVVGRQIMPLKDICRIIAETNRISFGEVSRLDPLKRQLLALRSGALRCINRCDTLTYFVSGQGDRVHRAYSHEKAVRQLSYRPKIDLEQGIKETLRERSR